MAALPLPQTVTVNSVSIPLQCPGSKQITTATLLKEEVGDDEPAVVGTDECGSHSHTAEKIQSDKTPQHNSSSTIIVGSKSFHQQSTAISQQVASNTSLSSLIISNRPPFLSSEATANPKNTVIQVMCELPIIHSATTTSQAQQTTQQHCSLVEIQTVAKGHHNGGVVVRTINEPTTIPMKTHLVPVLLTTSPTDKSVQNGTNVSISTSSTQTSKSNKVGRPRRAEVEMLKAEGESSTSEMKCLVCKRVFPRVKSLEAHMRIHTGEKPYQCDFPHCDRSFNQGGQLRTHHRLHTGEKPFKCGIESCMNRYAHANRSCPTHVTSTLKRVPMKSIQIDVDCFPNKDEVAQWLYRYGRDHKIDIEILRYNNPALKAKVMAELVVLKNVEPPQMDATPPTKRPSSSKTQQAKKQKTGGKSNEIQGALALMELAGK